MSDASKIKDSEGQVVNIKDAQARADIATINSSLTQYELTYTGNTNSSGLIVTDIPFNSKIRHAYITQSDNTPIYCLLRPSSGGYVVALPITDAFQKAGVLSNATVHVFVNGSLNI